MAEQQPLSRPDTSRDGARFSWILIKALPQLFRQASSEWLSDNAPRLGASVAFYTLLSLAPVLVIAVALAAVVYGEDAAQGRLASEIRAVAGRSVALTVQDMLRSAYTPRTGVIATSLGVATLVFGASSVFVELRDAMNTIWHVAPTLDRTNAAAVIRLIRNRFYSFFTVLGSGFLLLVSILSSAWIAAIGISVPRAATFVISYLVVAALFAMLYKIIPDVTLKWSDVAFSAMTTALFFMIGRQLVMMYFGYTSLESTYNAAGSPVVVLLWVFYSAQLFFWGAELSKAYTTTLGSHRSHQR